MNNIIYIKFDQEIKVSESKINIGMLGTVICSDSNVESKIKVLRVITFKDKKPQKIVFSVMKIIEMINESFPEYQISNIGENEFIVDYNPNESTKGDIIKVILTGFFVFMGASYSIIAYNNDVGVNEIFATLYELFTGRKSDGTTTLELGYCIGLFVGIMGFYNHIFKHRFSSDPTPLEVELKSYKEDINKAVINDADAKGEIKDAN